MQRAQVTFEDACKEICNRLLAISNPTDKDVKKEVKRICTKYALERIPRNYEILASVAGPEYIRLQKALIRKPVKTASGVAVIALMPKPY
ncbi:MAG: tRNA uridine(34) 5-carboxymethylaminomethyl modification radical SAM/GNAT enzyme Elp3, partial [Candidatus Nitrosotalea sp.]|nr:tRNA uridine(34) 5-carboxymethylaminomethyl modification radical SAM/GNAT enzyme Elp3 [Candidatus Nitrosotalea sp.]